MVIEIEHVEEDTTELVITVKKPRGIANQEYVVTKEELKRDVYIPYTRGNVMPKRQAS